MKQGEQFSTVLLVNFQEHDWIGFLRPQNGGLGEEFKIDKNLMAGGNGAILDIGCMTGGRKVPL